MNEEHEKLIGREFRHFKGGHYRLEGFAKDSGTLEEMVVYRALYGEYGLWVRPAKMFFETIERDGKRMKRFERFLRNRFALKTLSVKADGCWTQLKLVDPNSDEARAIP